MGEKGGGNCNSALTFIIKTLKDASCYFMHNYAYFFTNEFSSFDLFFYCFFHISFNTKRGLIWLLVDFFFFTLVHIDSKALAQDRLWVRAYKEEEGEALPRLLLFVNCATALSKWAISLSMSASASYPSLPSLPSSSSPSKFCLAAEQRMNNTWKIGNWFLENWILTSSNPTCSKDYG